MYAHYGQSREVPWQSNGFSVNEILMKCSIQQQNGYGYMHTMSASTITLVRLFVHSISAQTPTHSHTRTPQRHSKKINKAKWDLVNFSLVISFPELIYMLESALLRSHFARLSRCFYFPVRCWPFSMWTNFRSRVVQFVKIHK